MVDGPEGRQTFGSSNQCTTAHIESLVWLIAQTTAAPDPEERACHSFWIEAGSTPLPAASPADVGPTGPVVLRYTINRDVEVTIAPGGQAGRVRYTLEFDETQANGETWRAFGLYTRGDDDNPSLSTNPTLLARYVLPIPLNKTSDVTLTVQWDLIYEVAT